MDREQAKSGYQKLSFSQLSESISQTNWLKPLIFDQVTSTNDVAVENLNLVSPGAGIVVIADEQTKGRGRLDRKWSTPPGSGIAMSIAMSTDDFKAELSAVPLICGLAVNRALNSLEISSYLKWPNDIVFADEKESKKPLRKAGGILAQLINDRLIIGIGLNVALVKNDLPVSNATSLNLEGFQVDRNELITKVLEEINYLRKTNNSWLEEYKKACVTLNKNISVVNNSGESLTGTAVDVSPSGALVIKNLENLYQVTVGDIGHFEAT